MLARGGAAVLVGIRLICITGRRSAASAEHRFRESTSLRAHVEPASENAKQRSSAATTSYTGLWKNGDSWSSRGARGLASSWPSATVSMASVVSPAAPLFNSGNVISHINGRGSEGRDRTRERRSASTVGEAPWACGAACSSVGTEAG